MNEDVRSGSWGILSLIVYAKEFVVKLERWCLAVQKYAAGLARKGIRYSRGEKPVGWKGEKAGGRVQVWDVYPAVTVKVTSTMARTVHTVGWGDMY